MTERPILFSDPMGREVPEGHKTQRMVFMSPRAAEAVNA